MSEPQRKRSGPSAGAFLSPVGPVAAPTRTLSDEYHDEPAEPEDSSKVPEPEPPGLVRRILDRLSGSLRPGR